MNSAPPPARLDSLGVLLPLGGSLRDLDRHGQLGRVLDYYVPAWLTRFEEIVFFSYEEEDLAELVPSAEMRDRLTHVAVSRPGQRHLAAAHLGLGRGPSSALRACSTLRVLQAPGSLPAILARTPYVCTYGYAYDATSEGRGIRFKRPLIRGFLRTALRTADTVIVTSRTGESQARSLGARRIARIPNGVDLDLFAPHPQAERRYDLAFVGRLVDVKDLGTLIAAAGQIMPRPSVLFVGDGPLRERLLAQAEQIGVPLTVTGVTPYQEIPSHLASSTVFVLPSKREGHPKALIEAMAMGMPCVGTDIPSIAELSEVVTLTPRGDPVSLAARLQEMLGDPAAQAAAGQAARAMAVERFDLRRLLERETNLLTSAAQRHARIGGPDVQGAPEGADHFTEATASNR